MVGTGPGFIYSIDNCTYTFERERERRGGMQPESVKKYSLVKVPKKNLKDEFIILVSH